jgi:endonuclease/exonuclease/phosphatase (EEP) superfamily protein YafD
VSFTGPVRVVAASIAGGALAGSVVLSLTWATTPGAYWFVMLTTLVPYAVLSYLLAAVLLLALRRGTEPSLRRWVSGGAVLALAGFMLQAGVLAPNYLGAHAHGQPNLTVMTLNLRKGGADESRAVALARTQGVRVLVLEEVTPGARDQLRAAGLDALLPHVAGDSGAQDAGTMVFSSYELAGTERLAVQHDSWKIRVLAPKPFWLFAVHTSQPTGKPAEWAKDWRAIDRAVRTTGGARLIAGDFNATLDHRPVRNLLGAGFSDAARSANSGWQPTWAALFTIDHVLFSDGFGVIATRTARVAGSDHRAVVAELVREAKA